jgi:small GTP-binding protein
VDQPSTSFSSSAKDVRRPNFLFILRAAVRMSSGADPYEVKVTTIGDASVGKTSLLHVLRSDVWKDDCAPTIGFANERLLFPSSNIRLNLSDTAGQEAHAGITVTYLRNSRICLLCFDVNSPATFVGATTKWIKMIDDACSPPPIRILIGAKCDLMKERLISEQEIEAFRKENNIEEYFETSAKAGTAIAELRDKLEEFARQIRDAPEVPTESGPVEREKKEDSTCC